MFWIAAAGAAGFAVLAAAVARDGGPLPGDRPVLTGLRDLRDGEGTEPLTRLADLTDLAVLVVPAIALGLGLLWARRWRDLAYSGLVVGVVWVLNPLLKELFARARPDVWVEPIDVSPHSFPSGHAANTAALAAAVVLVVWSSRGQRPTLIVGIAGAAIAGVVLVGVGQLALGVHYPSDILAGWLWAGAWAAAVWSRWSPKASSGRDGAASPSAPS